MSNAATQIDAYEKSRFEASTSEGQSISHDIYRRGSGAPVILIQELPGIGQETLALADELVDAGFEVVMPHLFGPLGKTSIGGNLVRVCACARSFAFLAATDRALSLIGFVCCVGR